MTVTGEPLLNGPLSGFENRFVLAAQQQSARVETERLSDPDQARLDTQVKIAEYLDVVHQVKDGKKTRDLPLFPQANRRTSNVRELEMYSSLSAVSQQVVGRDIGVEFGGGNDYRFVMSAPYKPKDLGQDVQTMGPDEKPFSYRLFMYERIGLYFHQNRLLSAFHFLDTGTSKGPTYEGEDVLNKGVIFTPREVVVFATRQPDMQIGGRILEGPEIRNFVDKHILPELEELDDTVVPETTTLVDIISKRDRVKGWAVGGGKGILGAAVAVIPGKKSTELAHRIVGA